MQRTDVDHPKLLDLFPEHLDSKRSQSASFLIWYLQNYYRLDPLEAVDAVCDQSNDKGVDGIYVNDHDQTITVFQSKISQKSNTTIGDSSLRTFAGTLGQFANAEKMQNLVDTAGEAQVAKLIKRLDLASKLSSHDLRGEFVANIDIDSNGQQFLDGEPSITFVGKSKLVSSYISDKRNLPVHAEASFDIFGFNYTEYVVDTDRKAVIAPVRATQLIQLQGIEDQSLFAYNVRGPLGRTKINKEIVASIRESSTHKLFPLFHNGITIIAGKLEATGEAITVSDYYVVNGCQSLSALFAERTNLTDDLRILIKIIQLAPASKEASMITAFSNNQNGVRSRDFKANTQPQIRLQNEFKTHYEGKYVYEIKRGEALGDGTVISNETAGLYLMAFDLKLPWGTHRKYEVFEDRHNDLFGRPDVTADRIVMCQVIMEVIQKQLKKLDNQLFAKYVLTQYALLYIVREILERDDMAAEKMAYPETLVRNEGDRELFRQIIEHIVSDIINDLNEELKEAGEDFDYRDKLRDSDWVLSLRKSLVTTYQKLVSRGYIKPFSHLWP